MYFNGHDATITIKQDGDTLTAEVVTIEFSQSFQKIPTYGYKSITFDDILEGEKLIQGQFSVTLDTSNLFKRKLSNNGEFNVPEINGVAPVSRDIFDIFIKYSKTELEKKDVYSEVTKEPTLTLKDVKITGFQTAFANDGSAALEFYNFVAREIE